MTGSELNEVAEDPAAGWLLWESDGGGQYATRKGPRLSDEEIARGMAMTVAGDTPEELMSELRKQAALQQR
jgi:hypothetical protein